MIFEPLLNIEMIIFAVPSIGMVPFVGSGRSVHGSIHTEELRKQCGLFWEQEQCSVSK
jgi:hypothetical protein